MKRIFNILFLWLGIALSFAQQIPTQITPKQDIANKTPYQGVLGTNDVIMAGDFPVTIKRADGIGNYSGEGYIVVPYLGDTKLKVSFNNIQINTDKKLIAGTIETTYDPSEKAVMFLSEGIGETFGDQGVKEVKVGYNISKVEYVETPPPGRVIIHGNSGSGNNNDSGSGEGSQQELLGGRDYTIIGQDGKVYEIDEKGNVKEGGKIDDINSIPDDNVLTNKFKELKFIYEGNEGHVSEMWVEI